MGTSCTIFAIQLDRPGVLSALGRHQGIQIEVRGGEHEWSSIRLVHASGEIEFNALFRLAPRDEASRILLGMHNWVRNAKSSTPELRARVGDRILDSRALIGIVASSELSPNVPGFIYVTTVAEVLNGVIFTGGAILDAKGERLLPS